MKIKKVNEIYAGFSPKSEPFTKQGNIVVFDNNGVRKTGTMSELSYDKFRESFEEVMGARNGERIVQIEFTKDGIKAIFEKQS